MGKSIKARMNWHKIQQIEHTPAWNNSNDAGTILCCCLVQLNIVPQLCECLKTLPRFFVLNRGPSLGDPPLDWCNKKLKVCLYLKQRSFDSSTLLQQQRSHHTHERNEIRWSATALFLETYNTNHCSLHAFLAINVNHSQAKNSSDISCYSHLYNTRKNWLKMFDCPSGSQGHPRWYDSSAGSRHY